MKFERGEVVGGVVIGTARDKWRRTVTEAHTDLRLRAIGNRAPIAYETALIRAMFAEIFRIRLEAAFAPIFNILQRIEWQVGALADLRREPWAPSKHPINR